MRGSLEYPREVKVLKRISLILVLACAIVMLTSGIAYANFGVHGSYDTDTDACAACHRAHTSFAGATWEDDFGNEHSALLVGTFGGNTISAFCYTCHGDSVPGASTNVFSGVFDAGPSGSTTQPAGFAHADEFGTRVAYETSSTFGMGLNGGGFYRYPGYLTSAPATGAANGYPTYTLTTSAHDMDDGAATDPMWGDGFVVPSVANLTCTDCHDPHGSSNYRILKDKVNGNVVGGYAADASQTPDPYVISNEIGYPQDGWRKGAMGGRAQMDAYVPNYTEPLYSYKSPVVAGEARSMSTWCAACHERYDNKRDDYEGVTYDYLDYEAWRITEGDSGNLDGTVDGDETAVGARARHRHPVNITLVSNALMIAPITDTFLPLEENPSFPQTPGIMAWDTKDYLGCLTCHFAHGTTAEMTGWAEASLVTTDGTNWYPSMSDQPTQSGVNPNFTSALLRVDNRGVCERCHNK
jgi:predicted CXXCH cytochrome family protein